MKITTLGLIATTLFCFTSYADDAPNFVKVGSTYILSPPPGIALPPRVTIAAAGGGGWFRVTTPKSNDPNAKADPFGVADRWINFNQLVQVYEIPNKGVK